MALVHGTARRTCSRRIVAHAAGRCLCPVGTLVRGVHQLARQVLRVGRAEAGNRTRRRTWPRSRTVTVACTQRWTIADFRTDHIPTTGARDFLADTRAVADRNVVTIRD
jgi:hypothetical protein